LDVVRRDVRAHALWPRGARVVLACSGGLDSLVALELLARLQRSLGHTLAVAHVDHGLHSGSDRATALVRQAATLHGLAFASRTLHIQHGADLEGRARTLRYRALDELRLELHGDLLATAHHADDQAETLLMRAARGGGLEALAGIRRARDGAVVRPLLGLDRAWLVACGKRLRVTPHEDPTNADLDFCRNRLRHEVLPALEEAIPGAARGLARTAGLLSDHTGTLDGWIERALGGGLVLSMDEGMPTAWLAQSAVPAEGRLQAGLLQFVCRKIGVSAPTRRATDQVTAWAAGPMTSPCHIHGLTIDRDCDGWRFRTSGIAREGCAD
jgi:tRNA(Ile)-lysidine synthase